MINHETIQIGRKYKVIQQPHIFTTNLVGLIGICKWASIINGACLKFPDGNQYVIPFDCLSFDINSASTIFRSIPTIETAICGQYRYRLSKLPDEKIGYGLLVYYNRKDLKAPITIDMVLTLTILYLE